MFVRFNREEIELLFEVLETFRDDAVGMTALTLQCDEPTAKHKLSRPTEKLSRLKAADEPAQND